MKLLIISVSMIIAGCMTPRDWTPSAHQEMMMMCRNMCKEAGVKSYEPFSGECSCNKKYIQRLRGK